MIRRRQNYRSGRAFENEHKQDLLARLPGLTYVTRSAGSKGPADLIAWGLSCCIHVDDKKQRDSCTGAERRRATLRAKVQPACGVLVRHLGKDGGFCEH